MGQTSFWSFTFGNVATLIVLLTTLVKFHYDNVKRVAEATAEMQSLKDSVSRLLDLEDKFSKLDALSAKLDVIYPIIMDAFTKGKFSHGD